MSGDAVTKLLLARLHRYWQIILMLLFILNSSSLLHLSVLPSTLHYNEYLHNLKKQKLVLQSIVIDFKKSAG